MKLTTKLFAGGEEEELNASFVFFFFNPHFHRPDGGRWKWWGMISRVRRRGRGREEGGGGKGPEILVDQKNDGACTLCKSTTLPSCFAFAHTAEKVIVGWGWFA